MSYVIMDIMPSILSFSTSNVPKTLFTCFALSMATLLYHIEFLSFSFFLVMLYNIK